MKTAWPPVLETVQVRYTPREEQAVAEILAYAMPKKTVHLAMTASGSSLARS